MYQAVPGDWDIWIAWAMDEAKIPAFVEITFYFIRDNAGREDYRN